jgi:hypothetical protein
MLRNMSLYLCIDSGLVIYEAVAFICPRSLVLGQQSVGHTEDRDLQRYSNASVKHALSLVSGKRVVNLIRKLGNAHVLH